MIHWKRILVIISSTLLSFTTSIFAEVQTNVANQSSASTVSQDRFAGLRKAVALYQNASHTEWQSLPNKLLKIHSRDKTILLLRHHLKFLGDLSQDNDTGTKLFDEDLKDAVALFQWRHGLKADGIVGKKTITALNITPQFRLKQLYENFARWTQLSKIVNNRYVLINIPEFQLHVYEDGVEQLTMKVIVGKPERPTPELYSMIRRIVLNPYWNVPKTIAQKDFVQKIMNDPNYLSNSNIKVYKHQEENAAQISEEDVDLSRLQKNGAAYHFRQEPGANNSLGLIKFEFKNPFDVYLHDTPVKELFESDERAFSSGCIRLEKPFDLADYLMKEDEHWDEKNKEILDAGKTVYLKIRKPIPIYITYITAWVDDSGISHFRSDIYNKD